MLMDLLPDELSCLRTGRIIIVYRGRALREVIHEGHERRKGTFRAYEQTASLHNGKVFAHGVDRRPDRDHQLDSQLLQLAYHSCWIRPEFWIEAPISLQCPVEKVDNNNRKWQVPPFLFPCYPQEFIPGTIAEFTFPKTRSPFNKL